MSGFPGAGEEEGGVTALGNRISLGIMKTSRNELEVVVGQHCDI